MVVIIVTVLLGTYLAWSYAKAASYPVPHMSDEGEDDED